MSKAFTKETDDGLEDELDDPPFLLPDGAMNYMTPEGAEKFRAELAVLTSQKRPEALANPAAKQQLRDIERRIRFLQKRVDTLEVVHPSAQPVERVLFGARVTVQDEEGRKRRYQVVGIDEAEPASGLISWISPLAKALLNKKIGDVVTLITPRGEEDLEIIAIG